MHHGYAFGEPDDDLHPVLDHQHRLAFLPVDRADQPHELVALIGAVHREEGKTVLMVEHRMEVVVGLAERIAVMHHGSLLAFDTPAAVMANQTVQTAYLGEPL